MEPHASNVDQLSIIFGRDFLESPPVFKFHGMYGVYVDVYVCVKGGGVVFFFWTPLTTPYTFLERWCRGIIFLSPGYWGTSSSQGPSRGGLFFYCVVKSYWMTSCFLGGERMGHTGRELNPLKTWFLKPCVQAADRPLLRGAISSGLRPLTESSKRAM